MEKRVPMSLTEALRKKERRRKLQKGIMAASLAVMAAVSWNLRYIGITKADLYCSIDENHIHAANCYEDLLACQEDQLELTAYFTAEDHQQESQSRHEHGGSCYRRVLNCSIPQDHKHILECSSNREAVETEKDWTAPFGGKKSQEEVLKELVRIARSQAGYKENKENFKIHTDYGYETASGYSRFGHWYEEYLKEKAMQTYQNNGQDVPETIEVKEHRYDSWDTLFVSFCLSYAGLEEIGIPIETNARDLYEKLQDLEKEIQPSHEKGEKESRILIPADDHSYEAKAGDLVFFDLDRNGKADTSGIVTEVIAKTDDKEYKVLKVIEGDYEIHDLEENAEDGVCENEYRYENLTENGILAFGSLQTAIENTAGEQQCSAVSKEEDSESGKGSDPAGKEEQTAKSAASLEPVTDIAGLEDLDKKKDVTFAFVDSDGQALSSAAATYKPGKIWYHYQTKHDTIRGFSFTNVQTAGLNAAVWKFEKTTSGKYRIYTENQAGARQYIVAEYAGFIDYPKTDSPVINLHTYAKSSIPTTGDYQSEFTLNVRKNTKGQAEISVSLDYDCIIAYLGNVNGKAIAKNMGTMTGIYGGKMTDYHYTFVLYSARQTGEETLPDQPDVPETDENETVKDPNAPKNPDNTVINFFNYRVNNDYPNSLQASLQSTEGNKSWNEDVQYSTAFHETGINKGKNFKFGKTKEEGRNKTTPWYNDYVGNGADARYDGDGLKNSVVERLLDSNYQVPVIKQDIIGYNTDKSPKDAVLHYLFSLEKIKNRSREEADRYYFDHKSTISSEQREKYAAYAVPDTKNLLNFTKDGYWFYDSAEEFAELNQETGVFTKYDPAVAYDDGDGTNVGKGQFFPFNTYEYAQDKNCVDATLDHYFGMSLSTTFMQRYKGYSSADRDKPITFEFSGDDDVWIFIDGVLVSDISGIHQRVGVEIDFSTGKITHRYGSGLSKIRPTEDTLYSMFKAAGMEKNVEWDEENPSTFKNNTQHELKMFFLERGGSASNLKIKFNLIPAHPNYLYKTDQYGNPVKDAEFQVLDSSLNEISGYKSVTDEKGQFIFKDPKTSLALTMADMKEKFGEVFYLKETGAPAGYRKIQAPMKLEFKDNILISSEPFKTGVWSQTTASVTATSTLYKAGSDYSSAPIYDKGTNQKGTLFAMVLAKEDAANGAFDRWTPVIGNETIGFETFKPEKGSPSNLSKVIEAYQKAAKDEQAVQMYGKLSFEGLQDNAQLTLENLPGSITDYYTYREQHVPSGTNKTDYVNSSKYLVAYYFTTADSLSEMTEANTFRVESHEKPLTTTKIINPFDVQWGVKIEVPNVVNHLIFQKADFKGYKVAQQTAFALYEVRESGSDLVYVTTSGKEVILDPDTDGDNAGTIKAYDGQNKQNSNWTYKVLDDYSLDNSAVDCKKGGWLSGNAGVIVIMENDREVGRIVPARNGDTSIHSQGTPLVGATHVDCQAVKTGGVGHFSHIKNGNYVLREVKAPEGFKINGAETKVAVREDGVFAHAGTKDDGVTVYKGPGYLAHPMHRFASTDALDGTLAWITTALQVDNSPGFNGLSNLIYSQNYSKVTAETSVADPIGAGSVNGLSNADQVLAADDLLRNYLTYQSDHKTSGGLFDYDYNKKTELLPQGSKAGLDSIVLGVKEGWSNLRIFQDEQFWNRYKASAGSSMSYEYLSKLDYMQSLLDLSHLFSKSTFVEVADKVTAQITVVKTDEKEQPLDQAKFVLAAPQYDENDQLIKKYWSHETNGFTEYDAANGSVFESKTNGEKKSFFALPELDEGIYELEEIEAPNGFLKIKDPVEVRIAPNRVPRNGSPVLELPMIVKPVVTISQNNIDTEALLLDKDTPKPNDVYYEADGATFQFLFKIANCREGVDIEITKTDKDKTPLDGALFALYKEDPNGKRSYFCKGDNYDSPNVSAAELLYQWKNDVNEADLMDQNINPENPAIQNLLFTGGTFRIKGLPKGIYFLREIKPPKGFNPLAKDIQIIVGETEKGELTVQVDKSTGFLDQSGEKGEIFKDTLSTNTVLYRFHVKNTSFKLPETGGGYGNRYYIVLGLMHAGAAAGYKLLIRKKELEALEDFH